MASRRLSTSRNMAKENASRLETNADRGVETAENTREEDNRSRGTWKDVVTSGRERGEIGLSGEESTR